MNNELRILRTDHVILSPRKRSRRISGFIIYNMRTPLYNVYSSRFMDLCNHETSDSALYLEITKNDSNHYKMSIVFEE